jgi:hypothetical protein
MPTQEARTLQTPLGEAQLLRLLGRGKSGYSYLASLAQHEVVVKIMHDEPCAYYAFGANKVSLEVASYLRLCECGLKLPELLAFDEQRGYLVKEYVKGEVADSWACTAEELDLAVSHLFQMANSLQAQGLNIDYFPSNFVIRNHIPNYIDFEANPYSSQWSLSSWGIYYWANRDGMRRYSETGDWRHINQAADTGDPIREPFEDQVARWRTMFAAERDA